jgi:PilZ domain
MQSNRRHKRKDVSYPAWLFADGKEPQRCMIEDASVGGAQLLVNNSKNVHDRFRLGFSPTAHEYRNCIVRWRRDGHIGVQFYNDVTPDPTRAKLV